MLPVTTEWKNAVKAQFRRQAYLKFNLEVTPPDLRKGLSVTSLDTSVVSNVNTTIDHLTDAPTKYFSFERNRVVLNGTIKFLRKGQQTEDWWAEHRDQGNYTLSFSFDKPYSIPGVYVEWDLETHSYPSLFTIVGYNYQHTESYRFRVDSVTSESGFVEAIMDDIQFVDIIIESWVNPTWVPRMNEILFGLKVSFDSINNGRISKASTISSSDPLAKELPKYDVTVELRNIDKYFDPELKKGVSKYIAQRQIASYQWGFYIDEQTLVWLDKLPIYVDDFDVPEDSKDVKINLTSRLSFLTKKFLLGTYTGTNRTLYDIATYILDNSDVLPEFDGTKPWMLPEKLKQFNTSAPIPADSINVLLKFIAFAAGCWLTTDELTGFIKIMEPNVTPVHDVSVQQELGDPSAEIADRIRSVTFGVYQYQVSDEPTQVGKGTYHLAGTKEISVSYTKKFATEVSANVSGATLQGATYYATSAVLRVTAPLSGADVEIILTGKEVVENVAYIETFRDESIGAGRDLVIENSFVTDTSNLQELTEYVKKYYGKRTTYQVPYTGYPELEAGDNLNFETVYGESTVDVTSNKIEYNGAWTGTLNVV